MQIKLNSVRNQMYVIVKFEVKFLAINSKDCLTKKSAKILFD